jgi:lambda family phage portal protein
MSRRPPSAVRDTRDLVAAHRAQTATRQPQVDARTLRARFDAAQTTDDNRKHWVMADGLSADAAASAGVRRTLRNRSRYERSNNSYFAGCATTIANDCIGTGPRLQLVGKGLPREDARFVEHEFGEWTKAIGLAEKLRTTRAARVVDGEGFGIYVTNPALPTRVKLDLSLLEAEQVASPWGAPYRLSSVDGIDYDTAGNPSQYWIFKQHPGGLIHISTKAEQIPADQVLHYFVPERPGQRRGIPEVTPALPLFAQLRRWTLSVVAAAETAADFAAILYTEDSPDAEGPQEAKAFDRLEIERRGMVTMPYGWKMQQFKAEQPTSTYPMVKSELLNEIARALMVPYNVAAGNSSGYNYSSGRLDFQIYQRQIEVDRGRFESQWLERIFAAWKREAILIEGYLPQSFRMMDTDWAHAWHWDGFAHIDPESEANAQATRLANRTTTLAKEYGIEGEDWEEQLEQIAKEMAKVKELEQRYGIKFPNADGKTVAPQVNVARDRQQPAPAAQPQGVAA